jgi:hypothetical protein
MTMPNQPLVVPVQLDALVVNENVLARDTFRLWPFNYLSLKHWKSPEPEPIAFDRSVGTRKTGVYLHWTLPDALRHGTQDMRTGGSNFPIVPNRWLVVRMNGATKRQATAWVVESDCPFSKEVTSVDSLQTSMYLADADLIQKWKNSQDPIRGGVDLDPHASEVQVATIGIRFPLADWRERAADTMFLTAVAPSNPLFSIYTAHNIGVFSFYDDLDGISDDILSYFLFGWFSDPTKDIMASWPANTGSAQPYGDLLERLDWIVTGGTEEQATASVYQGMVLGVLWNRRGDAPADDPLQAIRDSGKLNVAIGNTTIDAFAVLVEQQLNDPRKAKLLRAFQYDFLQQLNLVNGEALLDEKIRQAWFGSKAGGYSWVIVDGSSNGTTSSNLTEQEADWLCALNRDQASLDKALTELYSLQWELYSLWFKRGFLSDDANTFPNPPQGVPQKDQDFTDFKAKLASALAPDHPGSIAAQLVAQFDVVQTLLEKVPRPVRADDQNAQQAFQNGIEAFANTKRLDPAKKLKARAAPRYWQANNPSIVLSGVEPPLSAISANSLPVRLASDLVKGFQVDGATIDAAAVDGLCAEAGTLGVIPSPVVLPLLREFLLLDPANATYIAAVTGQASARIAAVMAAHDPAAYDGTFAALGLDPWQQPWNPMFMEWSANYAYVPFQIDATPLWKFDGTDYTFASGSPTPEFRQVGGISLLSPSTRFVFGARLQTFVKAFGTENELAEIEHWVEQVYKWQFLAQELTGFFPLLGLRDTRAFRRPVAADVLGSFDVAGLTGFGDHKDSLAPSFALPAPYQGQVNSVPFIPNGPALPFHGAWQGELYFTDLFLYDKFGRVLFAVESSTSSGLFDYHNFPLLIDDALKAAQPIVPGVAKIVRLAPRLVQPARLDMRLLDAKDDTKVYELDAGAVPIAGWLVPNHLDDSFLIYAPDGTALGEVRLLVDADGTKTAQWQPPPHHAMTLDDVRAAAPHLHAMIDSPELQPEANFLGFLASIDETLWTTDPLGNRVDQNLSILLGRPLALLRIRLQFQLDGAPIGDTGWAATFKTEQPEFLSHSFSIRLGDQATREDGLIGYFEGSNYDVFNSVANPRDTGAQTYVRAIGPIGSTEAGNYLQLSVAAGTYLYVTALADPRATIHARPPTPLPAFFPSSSWTSPSSSSTRRLPSWRSPSA